MTPRITFSRNFTISLSRTCSCYCKYCAFATHQAHLYSPERVIELLDTATKRNAKELLILTGDAPDSHKGVRERLSGFGYDSFVDYVVWVCEKGLERGLLPHTNLGVVDKEQLSKLRQVTASQGLMLETINPDLIAHQGSPQKNPLVRLETIRTAGELKIPFTTGILVGIGEEKAERIQALEAIAEVHREFGHIQEIILQNFVPHQSYYGQEPADIADWATMEYWRTGIASREDKVALPSGEVEGRAWATPITIGDMEELVQAAARLLPGVGVQIPPNLSDWWPKLINLGITDLGGLSANGDHISPEHPFPSPIQATKLLKSYGYALSERLCVYPKFISQEWLSGSVHEVIKSKYPTFASRQTQITVIDQAGVAGGQVEAEGVVGGQIGAEDHAGRRVEVSDNNRSSMATQGRSKRGDTYQKDTYHQSTVINNTISQALDKAVKGKRLTTHELTSLFSETRNNVIESIRQAADELRSSLVGDTVTFVVNRNINISNICAVGCAFCGFGVSKRSPDAYEINQKEFVARIEEAVDYGSTELCIQSGINPSWTIDDYIGWLKLAKDVAPEMHLHAYSPMEIDHICEVERLSAKEVFLRLVDAGLGSVPGTAAEVLDDGVRKRISPNKLPTARWVEIIEAAHSIGLRSTATVMFGHIEHPRELAEHMQVIRELQERTSGITEFVPLSFIPFHTRLGRQHGIDEISEEENLKHTAVFRLALGRSIKNLQASWVKMGLGTAERALRWGVNDLGGTLMEESISRMAGSYHGVKVDPNDLVKVAHKAGRPAVERTTLYESRCHYPLETYSYIT